VQCTSSRGLSIPKLETSILKLLFLDKNFRNDLLNAPNNLQDEVKKYSDLINNYKNDLKKCEKRIKRFYELLEKDELKNDDYFMERLSTAKKEKLNLNEKIENTTIKLNELNKGTNKSILKLANVNTLKEKDFSTIKEIIHSIIESINIYHKKNTKGGLFTISITFKRTPTKTYLTTDWQAKEWRYGFFNGSFGIKNNALDPTRKIVLKDEELIKFD
jgi:chromosome segregation ATPase